MIITNNTVRLTPGSEISVKAGIRDEMREIYSSLGDVDILQAGQITGSANLRSLNEQGRNLEFSGTNLNFDVSFAPMDTEKALQEIKKATPIGQIKRAIDKVIEEIK